MKQQLQVKPLLMWLAILTILATGIIHFYLAPDDYAEMAYKGIMFYLNGAAALVAAFGIYKQQKWGWWLGLAVAGGAVLMYAVSRTIGLPGLPAADESWLEPMGVLAVTVEMAYVLVAGWVILGHNLVQPKLAA